MYEIIDVTRDYLFVRLRLRDVQTGVTREWKYWDDLEEWLCKVCATSVLRQEHACVYEVGAD